MEVPVCSITFKFSKFWVVVSIQTFISEYTTDFVNTFHITNNQTLQRKFQSNSHVKVNIQSIVVSNKWTSFSTTWNIVKYWSFNFQEVLLVQVVTDCLNNLSTVNKTHVTITVGDQVKVTLAVNCFNIL